MNWSKLSIVLAFTMWSHLFALSGLLVLDQVPFNGVSAGAWAFSFLIAVIASTMASTGRET